MPRTVALLIALLLSALACRSTPAAPEPRIAVPRQVGTWQGSGDRTIGFDSQSGRFRIVWETRPEAGVADGRFRLTVQSGVSGRPLQEVVNQRGAGQGSLNFEDDPRLYQLLVESGGLHWSVAVDELVLVARPSPH
ncbi:MAG: hypothetical protein IT179_04325 [Acidobacteria bacterium]|nr:hypothetical protein [Acidobacteriota bacterium]